MTKITQMEAVYQAVTNVVGTQEGAYEPSTEQRAQVNGILSEGFKAGRIELKETPSNADKLADDSKLNAYCSGLQSNWLRKDKRLNGNVTYVAKNPGSRAGSGDVSIKAMRQLLATKSDASERSEIQSFIDKRLAEIKPAKSATALTDEQIAVLEAAGLGHFVK
jgi:hypothetical protein